MNVTVAAKSIAPSVEAPSLRWRKTRRGTSVDYEKLGIGREQVPELIRMAADASAPLLSLFVD